MFSQRTFNARALAVVAASTAAIAGGGAQAGAAVAHHGSGHATHAASRHAHHSAPAKRHVSRKLRKGRTDRIGISRKGGYKGTLRWARARTSTAQGLLNLPHNLYWGAEVGNQFTGTQSPWDMNAQNDFQSREAGGKKASIINLYAPFQDCSNGPCTNFNFPTTVFNNIRNAGAIPMFSWGSDQLQKNGPTDGNGSLSLQSVASGADDAYLRQFAADAKAWGHRFFLRFNYEMNTGWVSWAQSANGQNASQEVAAWRHVHDIFTSEGATNATWVWCPNVANKAAADDFSSVYPGDNYVDWTCLDGYNYGGKIWQSPDQVFKTSYDDVTKLAPSKPMMIGETGSVEDGGSKAQWISTLLKELPTQYPKIAAVNWFDNVDGPNNWTLESSSSAQSAFASGISNSAYQSGGSTSVSHGADASGGAIPAP